MSIDRIITNTDSGFADSVVVGGAGRWVHVSGCVGTDLTGKVVAGGLGAEADAAFDNIEAALGRAGTDLAHVVKITAFVTSLDDYGEYGAARLRRFAGSLPASSTVQVANLLLGAQIEIEAVAFVDES